MPLTSCFFRDEVETKLVAEVQELRDNVSVLQEMLSEVRSTSNVIDKNAIDFHNHNLLDVDMWKYEYKTPWNINH
jgi:hypothetical protein